MTCLPVPKKDACDALNSPYPTHCESVREKDRERAKEKEKEREREGEREREDAKQFCMYEVAHVLRCSS